MAGRSGWVLNEMSPDKSGRLLLILPFICALKRAVFGQQRYKVFLNILS